MPPPPPNQQSSNTVKFEKVLDSVYGHRAVLYGPGGIGKSTLACLAPGPCAFVDADESLEKLKPSLVANGIPIPVKIPAKDYLTLRSLTQASGYDGIKSVIYDTWAPIEIWTVTETLRTIKKDNNQPATGIEDYGFGKGFRFVYDKFLPLLGDWDRHVRAGRNVIIIAHDTTMKVPNPGGQDFLRWEPNMQHTDKASVRYRMKEWADHLLFMCYDIAVDKVAGDKDGRKAGKATGAGSRTLYTAERPHFMAKSRSASADSYDITLGANPWPEIFR